MANKLNITTQQFADAATAIGSYRRYTLHMTGVVDGDIAKVLEAYVAEGIDGNIGDWSTRLAPDVKLAVATKVAARTKKDWSLNAAVSLVQLNLDALLGLFEGHSPVVTAAIAQPASMWKKISGQIAEAHKNDPASQDPLGTAVGKVFGSIGNIFGKATSGLLSGLNLPVWVYVAGGLLVLVFIGSFVMRFAPRAR